MSHADIHLRASIVAAHKIMSDAVQIRHQILPHKNALGELEYREAGVRFLPPSKHPGPWAQWAASNYFNAWWIVDFAFQLNTEFRFRFETPDDPHYLELQEWVTKANIMPIFPKPDEAGKTYDEFPVSLPPDQVLKLGDVHDMTIPEIYRSFYAAQRGRVRFKWTNRTAPSWLHEIGNPPF